MNNIYPIILCGGSGTRLWPLSREYYPKQFINFGSGTLFENTLSCIASLSNIQNPIIVCNEEHRFFVSKLLQQQNKVATIILESEGKNTAPAIALGVSAANELENDPLILVLPSDHLIGSNSIFHSAVMSGISAAIEGYFVTFGVNPTGPESGFGYLQYGQEVSDGIFKILNFTEKPSKARAKEFLALGNYAWNSGIFLFRASTYLNELELLAPQIFSACKQGWDERTQDPLGFFRPNSQKFLQSPSGSIDYVIMEKTEKLYMVKLETNWSDLGSWESCYNAEAHDSMGNVVSGDVIAQDTENCYLNSTQRLVCALGVKNIIVVETADAVLVVDRNQTQNVKNLLEQLRISGRTESETHIRVFRPWGSYETLFSSTGYKVKKITVSPGAALSLQLHRYRAEHWIVVYGIANVTINKEEHVVKVNQSIYIPVGVEHRLANYGKEPLEVIEVQSGSYVGEDDIIRLEDVYGRTEE